MKSVYIRTGKAISHQVESADLKKEIADEIKRIKTGEELERVLTKIQIENNLILPEREAGDQPVDEAVTQLIKNILLADEYMSCAALEKKYYVKPSAIRQAIKNERFADGEYYREGNTLMISERAFVRGFQKYLKSAKYLERIRQNR